jgi:hypothetical protein
MRNENMRKQNPTRKHAQQRQSAGPEQKLRAAVWALRLAIVVFEYLSRKH